jgi:putative solute:sodium symporter small subunit
VRQACSDLRDAAFNVRIRHKNYPRTNRFLLEGEVRLQLTDKHREYWHKNLVITAILMVVWFIATFVEGWYARELNGITFLGFPLGFYMSAQGSLIIYVVIIFIYARYMNNLDKVYGVHEGDDE